MPRVDVVIVSYNSEDSLPTCVDPLVDDDRLQVIVVDNASQDRSVESLDGQPVRILQLDRNYGFAYGCNRGWQAGAAPFVLFLNPDARAQSQAIFRLVEALEAHPEAAAVGPRIRREDGSFERSQRRFPRLRSTYAQAFFLHRVFPHRTWVDEVVHDPALYDHPRAVDWISGACVLVRREALERIDGWDERFFMYGEDKDLCRRLWSVGYQVRYDPTASIHHIGGQSAPRAQLLPTLVESRIHYARKHNRPLVAWLDRLGVATGALTHSLLSTEGSEMRAGYRKALITCFSGRSAFSASNQGAST